MKRKKIIVISLVILVFLILLVLVGIFVNSKKMSIKYNTKVEVFLNQKIYNTDNVKSLKNGTILTKKKRIDTASIGKKEVTIKVKDYFKRIKKFKYTVTIKDDESPVIQYNKELETEAGTEIDLLKDVVVTDNSKEKIIPTVEGEYDFNRAGEYKLFYTAVDSSKNEKKEEFILRVKEKKVVQNQNSNVADTTFTTSKGFNGVTKNGITYIDGYIIVNKTYTLPSSYGNGLTQETTNNFNIMKNAAASEGLNIYISSGFRSYSRQMTIYNNYVRQDGQREADTYSARAGHSEHQSGLAFDVNIINSSFANTNEARWLAANCYRYGFILRYPEGKTKETGYMYEPWHFRYVGIDLATKLYNNGNWLTMEDYFGITSEYQ